MVLLLGVIMLLPFADAVMEQVRDSNNGISWKLGTYRNRNVIPMPPGLDLLEKKHKRRDVGDTERLLKDKKSFIRGQRKGKKSDIPLSEKLAEPSSQYAPALENSASAASRSKVSKTWGMTWNDPHPNPELYRDTSGSERSILQTAADGVKKNGKISEKEFDSGLMGRGLGGMTERAQNENLMEQKFEEKIEDESDVELEDSKRERPRDRVIRIPNA